MSTQSLPEVDYTLTFRDGPDGRWTVLAYECHEELNGGSNAVLDLASNDPAVELSELLGSTCELALTRDKSVHYTYGVVLRVDLLGRTDHQLVIRVHVTSAFELGKQRRHSRIWQNVSPIAVVLEVLDEVLGAHGRTYEADALFRGDEVRAYCVQYRETDFDFVRRLLEEQGISYYFAHDPDAGHEVLTLCDENEQYRSAQNLDGSSDFPLIATNPEQAEIESLQSVEWSQQLTTTAILGRDYDWQHPRDLLTAKFEGVDPRGLVRRAYAHLERRFERDDLSVRVEDLGHAVALRGSVARGRSNIVGLRPGCRFTTDAHSDDGAPSEYIVTRVYHRGGDAKAGAGGGDAPVYSNEFECVPADRSVRPLPVTPKPDVRGAQTATVVGDHEIHTDEHGRIQVQFHWEESPSFASGASCWVRCAQSWAGPGWGAQFIPRVGMEVVVEFLEGNPDRPLVVGCVYNGDNPPPFSLPGSSTQSGWRSHSSPGGGGSNELRFEDSAGREEIYIRGQKDWRVEVNNDTRRSTGNDESHSVGRNLSESVGNSQSETVGVDKTIKVGSDHTETIGGTMSLMVGGNQTVSVGAHQTIRIASSFVQTVGSSATQTIAATKNTTVAEANIVIVGGEMNTSVGDTLTEEIGGAKNVTVSGMSTETVVRDRTVKAANIEHNAKKKIHSEAGTEFTVNAGELVGLSSDGEIGATAKKIVVSAGDEFVVECGASTLTLKKNGHIEIEGTQITLTGSEMVTIRGAKILEN